MIVNYNVVNRRDIERNQESITELSWHGQWCGYKHQWETGPAVITFDKFLFQDSNIKSDSLDIGTGETLIKHETSDDNNKSISEHPTKTNNFMNIRKVDYCPYFRSVHCPQ